MLVATILLDNLHWPLRFRDYDAMYSSLSLIGHGTPFRIMTRFASDSHTRS